jgi:hypothetical protein
VAPKHGIIGVPTTFQTIMLWEIKVGGIRDEDIGNLFVYMAKTLEKQQTREEIVGCISTESEIMFCRLTAKHDEETNLINTKYEVSLYVVFSLFFFYCVTLCSRNMDFTSNTSEGTEMLALLLSRSSKDLEWNIPTFEVNGQIVRATGILKADATTTIYTGVLLQQKQSIKVIEQIVITVKDSKQILKKLKVLQKLKGKCEGIPELVHVARYVTLY